MEAGKSVGIKAKLLRSALLAMLTAIVVSGCVIPVHRAVVCEAPPASIMALIETGWPAD